LYVEFDFVSLLEQSKDTKRMSRPHGTLTARPDDRITSQAPSFHDARRALVDILDSFCFVKVVSVQHGQQTGQQQSFHGEAVETNFRDARERPKLVFFDKFGRTKGLMRIGPIQIAQAPLGPDHPSAVPTAGDFLMGSAVPNQRKGPQEFVLRGWTSNAKPLWELLRILKFGTRASEFECRSLLVQSCSTLQQASDLHKSVRDDIYMAARIVLWKTLRPLQVLASQQSGASLLEPATEAEKLQAASIRIGCTAMDFIDGLTLKLNDSGISECFGEGLTMPTMEEYDPSKHVGVPFALYQGAPAAAPLAAPLAAPVAAAAAAPLAFSAPMAYKAPPIVQPSEWLRQRLGALLGPAAIQAASAAPPTAQPSAQQYEPKSPEYEPVSPAYVPTSPMYAPVSPESI
jgi:hypothetical protein